MNILFISYNNTYHTQYLLAVLNHTYCRYTKCRGACFLFYHLYNYVISLFIQFGSVEAVLVSIFDSYPNTLYKPRNRTIFTAGFCCVGFLLGLTNVTQVGRSMLM